jgi:general secretion pathway protein G
MYKQGFTLMEMLIVVTIIGILAAIVLPRFTASATQSKKSAHIQERVTMNGVMEIFYFKNESYPTAMTNAGWVSNLDDYTVYFPDSVPSTCNQNTGWEISGGRISMTGHNNHE